jgi:hypothetical protein
MAAAGSVSAGRWRRQDRPRVDTLTCHPGGRRTRSSASLFQCGRGLRVNGKSGIGGLAPPEPPLTLPLWGFSASAVLQQRSYRSGIFAVLACLRR